MTIDERLQDLANNGADITIKLRKQNAFVQVRTKTDTYKASGGTISKAVDRVMEAYYSGSQSIKNKRKEKEELRERMLEE